MTCWKLQPQIQKKSLKMHGDSNIKSMLDSHGLKQIVKSPTRITKDSSSLIDVICVNKPQNISTVKVIGASLSDHEMIGCARKLNHSRFSPRTIISRNMSTYCKVEFCNLLRNADFTNVYSHSSPKSSYQHFKEVLLFFIDKCAPKTLKKVRGRQCPWLKNETKKEMIKRDKQLRKARRGNSELEWSKYKHMKNRVNNLVKSNKNSYYRELLRKNLNNPRKCWKTIK